MFDEGIWVTLRSLGSHVSPNIQTALNASHVILDFLIIADSTFLISISQDDLPSVTEVIANQLMDPAVAVVQLIPTTLMLLIVTWSWWCDSSGKLTDFTAYWWEWKQKWNTKYGQMHVENCHMHQINNLIQQRMRYIFYRANASKTSKERKKQRKKQRDHHHHNKLQKRSIVLKVSGFMSS